MPKQLTFFPELALKLVTDLDELATKYSSNIPIPPEIEDIAAWKKNTEEHFKDGAKMVLADVIDLLKKYTNLHEV